VRVIELRTFPVKSMRGERPSTVDIDPRGAVGDRLWAVRDADGKLGSGKNTRRFRRMPGLLDLRARPGDPVPTVALPDGRAFAADDPAGHAALSELLGRPVTIAREDAVRHHDEGAVSVITTAALRALPIDVEAERFRANVLVDVPGVGFPEDDWLGSELHVGDGVILRPERPLTRCVMVDMAQGELGERHDVLRTVAARHDLTFGVWSSVVHSGRIRVGDAVRLNGSR
jgi:uncharacterized protein YcbX